MTERDVSSWVSSKLGKRRRYRGPDHPKPRYLLLQTIMQGNGFIGGLFGVHAAGKSLLHSKQT